MALWALKVLTIVGIGVALALGLGVVWPFLNGEVASATPVQRDALGMPVLLPMRDALGRISPGTDFLLVYAGSCDSCSLRTVDLAELPAHDTRPVALVYVSHASTAVRGEARERGVYLYEIPGWDFVSGLHPQWVGHWYLVSHGKVVRQAKTESDQVPL